MLIFYIITVIPIVLHQPNNCLSHAVSKSCKIQIIDNYSDNYQVNKYDFNVSVSFHEDQDAEFHLGELQ